jgi:hypothetical protein
MMHIAQNILDAVNVWLTPTFDNETQVAVKELMTTSPKELEESFYKNLEFGTGGTVSINTRLEKAPKDFLIICINIFQTNL